MPSPTNQGAGEPSSPLQIELWTSAQMQSQAYSEQTDFAFDLVQPAPGEAYPLGAGSQARGTFFTNNKPPNAGNQP